MKPQLIGLGLELLPVIGEVSGESSACYAEDLQSWAEASEATPKFMESELAHDKKKKLPIVVYALYEQYATSHC